VFLDGRGLSKETMQAIAKEMNFSESTFILPSQGSDADLRLRIFTPADELPMAGHPTIGSAFALAQSGVIASECGQVVFGCGVGPVPVALTWRAEALAFAWMTQGNPSFGDPIADPAGAAAALGLPPAAVAGTGLPAQIVSCGLPFLLVPLASRAAVDDAAVDRAACGTLLSATKAEVNGIFLFSTEPRGERATAYCRMFAPHLGIPEDPATGSASGPLGCYLVTHRVVPAEQAGAMLSLQGVKMGRPSHIHISIGFDAGTINSVRVGGEAVLAGEGTLYV
jgi:trans-2,3-dihydro-3-hydroxyanthranilate isomerase